MLPTRLRSPLSLTLVFRNTPPGFFNASLRFIYHSYPPRLEAVFVLSVFVKKHNKSLYPTTKLTLTVNMSLNKRPQQEEDVHNTIAAGLKKSYDLLETIDTLLRETLEDSVSCINPRAGWFEHLSEPDQIERVLQRVVTEGQNMTAELLNSYIYTVISRANWEMCQKLHQTEIALFKGLDSLHKSLSTRPINPSTLKEHMDKSDMITHELNNFHKSIVVDNMYSNAQQALIDGQDEFDFDKFVQDSVAMAFIDDPRGLLGLHSGKMFLDGIHRAVINTKYTWLAKEVERILGEELKVWANEVMVSYRKLQQMKRPKKS
jgi:hypothetical protein